MSSEFNAKGLRTVTDKPVHVVPHPTHAPRSERSCRIPELADEDLFTFLFVFDYLSVLERKNPVGLIEAFVQAFPTPGEARLIIKSINGAKRPADRERLLYAIGDRPDIVLVERYLDREELDGLMWNADCYVSLHRSEGFGQTLAEMMAIGKPVIATRYSGNLAFMDKTNSILVGQTLDSGASGQRALPGQHRSRLGQPHSPPGRSGHAQDGRGSRAPGAARSRGRAHHRARLLHRGTRACGQRATGRDP